MTCVYIPSWRETTTQATICDWVLHGFAMTLPSLHALADAERNPPPFQVPWAHASCGKFRLFDEIDFRCLYLIYTHTRYMLCTWCMCMKKRYVYNIYNVCVCMCIYICVCVCMYVCIYIWILWGHARFWLKRGHWLPLLQSQHVPTDIGWWSVFFHPVSWPKYSKYIIYIFHDTLWLFNIAIEAMAHL